MKTATWPVRSGLLVGTALLSGLGIATVAIAQDNSAGELTDIVVTAQKREQSVQDVPLAVTALTGDALQANRVVNVTDLSGLAPGVTVRPAAGGSKIPSFTIRGAVSYGVVPGSDKQVSIYLDGVYIGSPRGSIFDLPDVTRVEVLRGPQGTLFGRNATAGAVSVTTRDPSGKPGVRAEFTVGNYDAYRMRLTAELPQIGPFSAYGSFVHNYKRGDIRNAGAGEIWDRSNSTDSSYGSARSVKYLGTTDSNSYFAAVKFAPSDSFSTIYKFDHNTDDGTPDGTGFVGYNASSPLIGSLIDALVTSQASPVNIAADGKRPKVVSNSFVIPSRTRVTGHSLTSNLEISDQLSFKNVLAYRKASVFAATPIDGFSGLTFTPEAVAPYATFIAYRTLPAASAAAAIPGIAASLAPLVGSPFSVIGSQPASSGHQWSDELQLNYESDLLTLTAGALWFKSKDVSGGVPGLQSTLSFQPIPFGVFPVGNIGNSLNRSTSIAAYAQAEFHVTPQLDVVLGGRVTKDKKSGTFSYGDDPAALDIIAFTYKKTKPNYMVGVNYTPNDDLLLYGKYSTAFVSGGSVAGITFAPETAKSWEAGIKADLFDKRLRTNLSVYTVTYRNFQSAQSSATFGDYLSNVNGVDLSNVIGTFVISQGGPVRSRGFEFEVTARPVRNLTMGGSLGYTTTRFKDVNPIIVSAVGGAYVPALRPKWTGGIWGQYDSNPIAGDAYISLRADANWRSKMRLDQNPERNIPEFAALQFSPATWIVNGRAALKDLDIGGVKTELAVWGKNLTNNRSANFALITDFLASANYQPARTYGVDLIVAF